MAVPHRDQRLRQHAERQGAACPSDGPRADRDRAHPERLVAPDGDPADLAASRETVRLALGAALRHLSPRQRAALILCEVLRWRAGEVAELLETSVASVNSALQRARAALAATSISAADPAPQLDASARALLARYLDAFERDDVLGLARLVREDVVQSTPAALAA